MSPEEIAALLEELAELRRWKAEREAHDKEEAVAVWQVRAEYWKKQYEHMLAIVRRAAVREGAS